MDVIPRIVGRVELDDPVDARDVQSSRGDVGAEQDDEEEEGDGSGGDGEGGENEGSRVRSQARNKGKARRVETVGQKKG